jgi:glycosyltransferase involved in cell wall biosynthesis
MKMCQAFARRGHEVVLIAPGRKETERGVVDVFSFYGVEDCFQIVHLPWLRVKGEHYLDGYLAAKKAKLLQADLVYGRSLVGCFFAGAMGMPVVFESHAPADNRGVIPNWMFRRLISARTFQRLVVITHALKDYYLDRYPSLSGKVQVAPDGADPCSDSTELAELPNLDANLRVGYVGHLYPGRGIEIIEYLAGTCPWADFHVVGGTDQDIAAFRSRTSAMENLFLHGFRQPAEAERYRLAVDVLLAPYQHSVSVFGGGADSGLDTAKWMSPLKVFEYMAAGKAIVCSDLPVLREILTHDVNALLVSPSDVRAWEKALVALRDGPVLRSRLGRAGRTDFLARYTWTQRAANVLRELNPTASPAASHSPAQCNWTESPVWDKQIS